MSKYVLSYVWTWACTCIIQTHPKTYLVTKNLNCVKLIVIEFYLSKTSCKQYSSIQYIYIYHIIICNDSSNFVSLQLSEMHTQLNKKDNLLHYCDCRIVCIIRRVYQFTFLLLFKF